MTDIDDQDDGDPMRPVVDEIASACKDAGLTVAVVESLTSGATSAALGRGEDASDWFRGSVVAYQMHTKRRLLDVPPGLDPATPECALHLASHGLTLLDADVCVSITGVGGPDAEGSHPPGEVHVGTATSTDSRVSSFRFSGDPQDVVDQSVLAAVTAVRDAVRDASRH
ncbi:CinA family protein [Microbacterium telephonicum]|uniref:Nicotinamide-nucleotide amidase n=1 Tax=Microbacterium telephonicum TaxID=1714841 RepID=A0A498CK83_9MICO|nr:CinA family protein [Microbacterium telephonicum]RLK52551.1 nicotinamide-nucleotide amidase [Microbacterium telephonicum]